MWNCSVRIHCLVKRALPLLSFTQQARENFREDRAYTDRLRSTSSESVALSCLPLPPILLLVPDLFCWMLDTSKGLAIPEDCCSRLFTVTGLGSRLAQRWELCLLLQASVSSVEHLVSSCVLPPSCTSVLTETFPGFWLFFSYLELVLPVFVLGGGACSLAPLFCKHPISWLPKSSFLSMSSALFCLFLFYGKWSLPSNVRTHSFFRDYVGSSHWPRPFLPQNEI